MASNNFKILFFCKHNSVRAPLAAALTQRIAPPGVEAYSTGLDTQPLTPYVEQQIEKITGQSAKHHTSLSDLTERRFDLVVVLGNKAHPSPAESISLDERFPGAETIEWDMSAPNSDEDIKQIEIELSERIRLLLLVRHLL